MSGVPLFVVLDVGGSYFFAPSFTAFDHFTLDLEPGATPMEILPEFTWPSGCGSASGIRWYGALTDPEIQEILGGMGSFTFGWGESPRRVIPGVLTA